MAEVRPLSAAAYRGDMLQVSGAQIGQIAILKCAKIKVFLRYGRINFPSIGGEPLKTGCGINNSVVTGIAAATVSL